MPPSTSTTSFQKRVIVLGVLMVSATVLLGAQVARLTVFEGKDRLARAESRLTRTSYLPTLRGSILDRRGRLLAMERSSWEFQVDYEVLTGAWQRRQATRQARQELGWTAWATMGRGEQEEAIEARMPAWNAAVDAIWTAAETCADLDREGLDDDLNDIRRGVARRASRVWDRQYQRLVAKRGEAEARELFDYRPIAEQKGWHPILPGLVDAQAFPLRKHIHALDRKAREFGGPVDPAFRITDASVRERGFDRAVVRIDASTLPVDLRGEGTIEMLVEDVAGTIVGTVHQSVTADDIDRRPFRNAEGQVDLSGYRPGRDLAGSRGVEYQYDQRLHGAIGLVEEDLANGTTVTEIAPQPGQDVTLSLDLALQARLRALLNPELGLLQVQQWHYGWLNNGLPRPMRLAAGTPLRGAAVVLDIRTGEILAMVSSPSPAEVEYTDEERAMLAMSAEEVAALVPEDQQRRRDLLALAPFTNRAVETAYAPGSIVKPLMYVAGVSDGRLAHGESIECQGWYRCETCKPRCHSWRPEQGLYGSHGELDPITAITRSCNVYFYAVADRLGVDRLNSWYARFGLGDEPVAGLPRATRGEFVPNRTKIGRLLFGIGQGSVAWTPLQAAVSYARLARNGAEIDPRLVMQPEPEPREHAGDGRPWNAEAAQTAMDGMEESSRIGTAGRLYLWGGRIDPIMDLADMPGGAPTVWAKTGTAQVTARASHAWYAGLVAEPGSREPRYAFAVVVEHGNSGGRAAGPVANQLVRALAAEGYLGSAAANGATPVEWIEEEDVE
ncbi:MAG: hypothetical protein MK085_02675 [Phycisphaerales bacterium]|nr:hypothetical protein [Phycisphaerales bacterium]